MLTRTFDPHRFLLHLLNLWSAAWHITLLWKIQQPKCQRTVWSWTGDVVIIKKIMYTPAWSFAPTWRACITCSIRNATSIKLIPWFQIRLSRRQRSANTAIIVEWCVRVSCDGTEAVIGFIKSYANVAFIVCEDVKAISLLSPLT
jgi:hypothetical protein